MARHNPQDREWHNAVLDFHHFVLFSSENELLAAMWPPLQVTLQWSLNLQMSQPNRKRWAGTLLSS
jgi:DNA-binding FadR family transcriptional regulator